MKITDYVMIFPTHKQEIINKLLIRGGIEGDDLENAMCGRLCDLEEIISWEEMHELIKEE